MRCSTRSGFLLAAVAAVGWAGSAFGVVVVTPNGQTGEAPFTPTYVVSSTDLINGKAPTASAGSFQVESSGGSSVLTNGTFGTISGGNPGNNSIFATAGGGSGSGTSLSYTLDLAASPQGYNLTGIDVYGGWNDSGRDQQKYAISYSKVGAAAVILPLASVDFNPTAGGDPTATRVSVADNAGGFIATDVAAVFFTFDASVENGYTGYTEIDVFGQAVPEPATLGAFGLASTALLVRRGRRRRP
jgi:hypothetical protein